MQGGICTRTQSEQTHTENCADKAEAWCHYLAHSFPCRSIAVEYTACEVSEVKTFIKRYAAIHGLPQPAAPRGHNKPAPTFTIINDERQWGDEAMMLSRPSRSRLPCGHDASNYKQKYCVKYYMYDYEEIEEGQ